MDDGFGRAWRAAGKEREPRVEAVDLERSLAGLRSDKVNFATAGGGRSEGGTIIGVLEYRDVMSPEVIRARYEAGPPGPRAFGLSEFLASPGIVVNGERVSRRDVVKYVSNKLGGTHPPDPKRGAGDDAFRLLDHVRSDPRVGGKSAVYYELVSIGQAIAGSSGARELREFAP